MLSLYSDVVIGRPIAGIATDIPSYRVRWVNRFGVIVWAEMDGFQYRRRGLTRGSHVATIPRRFSLCRIGLKLRAHDVMSDTKEILDILCCPTCHGVFEEHEDWLVCKGCKRRYPIRDGIYVLLADEAVLPEEETITTD